jgi:hypothetical protein
MLQWSPLKTRLPWTFPAPHLPSFALPATLLLLLTLLLVRLRQRAQRGAASTKWWTR